MLYETVTPEMLLSEDFLEKLSWNEGTVLVAWMAERLLLVRCLEMRICEGEVCAKELLSPVERSLRSPSRIRDLDARF